MLQKFGVLNMARTNKALMNIRLRDARIAAGFKTATDAIQSCGWKGSTYRAHENGQNNYKVEEAHAYGKAYGVSAAWLLIGNGENEETFVFKTRSVIKNKKGCTPEACPEKIEALSLLLKDDASNLLYVEKLYDCVANYYQILQNAE